MKKSVFIALALSLAGPHLARAESICTAEAVNAGFPAGLFSTPALGYKIVADGKKVDRQMFEFSEKQNYDQICTQAVQALQELEAKEECHVIWSQVNSSIRSFQLERPNFISFANCNKLLDAALAKVPAAPEPPALPQPSPESIPPGPGASETICMAKSVDAGFPAGIASIPALGYQILSGGRKIDTQMFQLDSDGFDATCTKAVKAMQALEQRKECKVIWSQVESTIKDFKIDRAPEESFSGCDRLMQSILTNEGGSHARIQGASFRQEPAAAAEEGAAI
jgi:hypothetical protein